MNASAPTRHEVSSEIPLEQFRDRGTSVASAKSPQVKFEELKGRRNTPCSGRSKKWRMRKAEISEKLAGFGYQVGSPSDVFSRSMLSFDLEAKGICDGREDGVVGENELFVKFCMERRRSTGRGTLKTLINRRVALQQSGRTLAQRQAEKEVGSKPEKSVVPEESAESRMSKTTATLKKKGPPSSKTSKNISRRSGRPGEYCLEIPLAQIEEEENVDPVCSNIESAMSQTQVCVSQTQVWRRPSEEGSSPCPSSDRTPRFLSPSSALPFLSTPLEPVIEETERLPKPDRRIMQFLDIEASDSQEDRSEDEEGPLSDVSGLLASESEESDEDESSHVRLHQKWAQEAEAQFNPFQPKGRGVSDPIEGGRRRRRKNFVSEFRPKIDKTKLVRVVKKPVVPKAPIKPERPKCLQNLPQRPKKFPHRRSSVSSGPDVEVRVLQRPAQRASGKFAFIAAPSEEIAPLSVEVAQPRQRLLGAKRFVFGNVAAN